MWQKTKDGVEGAGYASMLSYICACLLRRRKKDSQCQLTVDARAWGGLLAKRSRATHGEPLTPVRLICTAERDISVRVLAYLSAPDVYVKSLADRLLLRGCLNLIFLADAICPLFISAIQ